MDSNKSIRFSVIALIIAGFAGSLGFRLSIPVVAFLSRDVLQLSTFIISFFYSGYMVSRALASITLGYIVDRYPKVIYFVPLFATIFAIIIYCYIFTNNWILIVSFRIIQGFLGGCIWPIVQYIVAQITPTNLRGRVLSIYFAMGSVGIFLSNIIYAVIVKYTVSYQLLISSSLFFMTAIFILLSIIFGNVTIMNLKRERKGKPKVSLLKEHIVLYVIIAGFLVSFSVPYVMGDISYVYISELLSLNKSDVALLLAFSGALGISFSYIISWLADKGFERETLALALILVVIALPLVSIKNIFLVSIGVTLALISIRTFLPLSRRYISLHSSMPATGIGAVNTTMNLGVSAGLIVFGQAYDYLKDTVFIFYGLKINLTPYILFLLTPLLMILALKLLKH